MSGPATSTGFVAAREPLGEVGDDRRVGAGAAGRPRARSRAPTASSATSAVQSSIGIETNAGPLGGSEARWIAAADRGGHVLGARRLEAPLDERVRHARGVAVGQVGLHRDLGADLLAGGDEQRRVVGLRVEDRAHRVADAGRGVEVDVATVPDACA